MNKKLVPIGNGWSVYMPVHIIKLMGVNPKESKVLFEVDGNILRVNKIDSDDESQNTLLVRKFIRSGMVTRFIFQILYLNCWKLSPRKTLFQ